MGELKQKQKFEQNWKKLTEITQEQNPEKSPKVEQNEVNVLFMEVAKERIEAVKVKFKTKLTGILDAKLALDRTLRNGRDELAKREEKEYETLNKELGEAFQMLNNAKQANNQLVNAASGNFEATEEETTEEKEPPSE